MQDLRRINPKETNPEFAGVLRGGDDGIPLAYALHCGGEGRGVAGSIPQNPTAMGIAGRRGTGGVSGVSHLGLEV